MVRGSNAAENTINEVNVFLCENDAASVAETIKKALAGGSLCRRVGEEAKRTLVLPWRDVVGRVSVRYREIIKEYESAKRRRPRFVPGSVIGKSRLNRAAETD
jgi:hypothetical protein